MQRLLDLLPPWLDEWRMVVNVGKTTALLTRRLRNLPPQLTLNGQKIAYEKAVTYLGCRIDRALRMTAHVDLVVRRARCARATLRPVLASKLPLKTKVRVYKTYIRSIITYAAPAWYALLSEPLRRRLQAQQNLTLRTIVGAGRYVRNDVIAANLKIDTIQGFVARLARGLFDRADNGPHLHINQLAPLHTRPPDGGPYPRELLSISIRESSNNPQCR
ncbi:unnamed protein product [Parnassius apollo]|uniref:(apollo) hypothetical protein n=1 Tax=Parnassius apollo TaxID=110799 RepID=A0A8S3W8N6_PARAO|nr:unnamed protein product [Parnassius apollo]